jgi:Fe-S oxidoreductase
VAIVGYEKLISTIKDAVPVLRTLPRNATAQLMTSYMSMISGPTPTLVKQNGEWVEQEKELHIILFDNGRLKAAKDDNFKQIYQCVRCASCLNVCPVYQLVGGHVYGHIYAGGIGAILTAFLHGMSQFEKFQELCIGCRKCTTVCPGKVDIPGLIEELRARAVKEHGLPAAVSFMFENVVSNRKVFHGLLRAASLGQKPFQSGKFIRHLPLFLGGLTKDRSLPAVASSPFRDRVEKVAGKLSAPKAKVAFFSGCAMDFVFPDTSASVFKVLEDLNIQVVFPEDQGCCGKPMVGFGDYETTKKVAKRNIAALESAKADYIIVACPSCTETLHMTYPTILADDPQWAERSRALGEKVREFTQFVAAEYEKSGRMQSKTNNGVKVTYHDSCHMKRVLDVHEEPRQLIASTGSQFVEMKDCDKCCGMSGVFGVTHADLSMPILAQKMENIKAIEADVVAVACPGCMVQIQGGLDKQAPNVKLKHIADILAENIKK